MSASHGDVVALLRECKRLPDDSVPSHVLADWLDDFGGAAERALAELIRHDCALETYPGDAYGDRQRFLAHREAWLGPDLDRSGWRVWRGLFRVRYEAADWSAQTVAGPGLPGGWEWVERVAVRAVKGANVPYAIAAAPLEAVASLDLSGSHLHSEGMRRLAGCERLGLVRELLLDRAQISAHRGLGGLLRSPHLGSLTSLSLRDLDLDHLGAAALAEWPGLARLERLDLSGNQRFNFAAVARLTTSPSLAKLQTLLLDRCLLDTPAARALAECPHLGNLRDLSLSTWSNYNRPQVLRSLLEAPWIGNLRRLCLPGVSLQEGDAAALADARLDRLEVLDLTGAYGMTTPAFLALAESPHLAGLRRLHLDRLDACSAPVKAKLEERFAGRLRPHRCEL